MVDDGIVLYVPMEGGPCFFPFLVTKSVVSNVVVEYVKVNSAA